MKTGERIPQNKFPWFQTYLGIRAQINIQRSGWSQQLYKHCINVFNYTERKKEPTCSGFAHKEGWNGPLLQNWFPKGTKIVPLWRKGSYGGHCVQPFFKWLCTWGADLDLFCSGAILVLFYFSVYLIILCVSDIPAGSRAVLTDHNNKP